MLLNKLLLSLLCMGAVAIAQASPLISCPVTFKESKHSHALSDASLFDGPPEELADQLPDSDREMKWTLNLAQESAKQRGSALYLVCKYTKTKKTVTLKVPQEAKTCHITIIRKDKILATCE